MRTWSKPRNKLRFSFLSIERDPPSRTALPVGIVWCNLSAMSVKDIPNFEQLTDLERLQLAEELIASIRAPEALPPPLAHRFELERRWAEYERSPSVGLSEEP